MWSEQETDGPRRELTRRQAVGLAGAAGAALIASRVAGPRSLFDGLGAPEEAQAAGCVLTPTKEEGPFFVDERLNRSDITLDPSNNTTVAGVPLALTLTLQNVANSCAPLTGVVVDIWHAAPDGKYSDESSEGTVGKKYLRGLQVTNASGQVSFRTIFPGWYSGRAVHVHFKIRVFSGSSTIYTFNGQLFFDPAVYATVLLNGAYSARGAPDTPNATDHVYGSDGSKLLVPTTPAAGGGYTGAFTIGLTGLPSSAGTGTGTNAVLASVLKTRFRRTKTGQRILRVTLDVNEKVDAAAAISRSGKRIARRGRKGLAVGTRRLEVPVPRKTKGGMARLTVNLRDATGKLKTTKKTVKVPKRLI